jgi:hypothetical protein
MRKVTTKVADLLMNEDPDVRRQGVELARSLSGRDALEAGELAVDYGVDLRAGLHKRVFQIQAANRWLALPEPSKEVTDWLFWSASLTTNCREAPWAWACVADRVWMKGSAAPWNQSALRLNWITNSLGGRDPGFDSWCRYWVLILDGGSHRTKVLRCARLLLTGEMPRWFEEP